jgi:hypothetical protein
VNLVSNDAHGPDGIRSEIAALKATVVELQERLGRQTVLLRAFFSLVRDGEPVTEAELLLRYRMTLLERAGGTTVRRCRKCGRTVNLRHGKCYYCAAPYPTTSAFDLLDAGAWSDEEPPPPADATAITVLE